MKADRVVQSVKAICNALAAVETPEITSALNQLPACPSRMQPKIQKVNGRGSSGEGTEECPAATGSSRGGCSGHSVF